MDNLNTFQIASRSYSTSITDESVFNIVFNKNRRNLKYVKVQSSETKSNIGDSITANRSKSAVPRGFAYAHREQKKIWQTSQIYRDTSGSYGRHRIHMGLRSRIDRNSSGSLPKEITFLKSSEISTGDRLQVSSFTTGSRSMRKCSLTVFTACAKLAGRSLGCFENCKSRPYSRKQSALSVRELSKSTHAGTDTLGRKNDPNVIKRVTKQVQDVFKKPTSYTFFFKGQQFTLDENLKNMYSLPELIFHRFQAVYDEVKDICVEKSRLVWCVPYVIVAIENCFFGKIIESTKQHSKASTEAIYPIGLTNFEIGQKSVRTIRNKFKTFTKESGYKIYSLDYSKFDASVPQIFKDIFFSLFRRCLELDYLENKVYDYLRIYVKYTPFIFKEELLYKKKGISSGLFITNFFDSWVNLTIHYFVVFLEYLYSDKCYDILSETQSFESLFLDKNLVKTEVILPDPIVRVMGDDSIFLCDKRTLELHNSVCKMLGMKVKIKHICHDPEDKIFFLGRYWLDNNRPTQSEEYIALRIVYCKWYNKGKLPFDVKKLHLYRILSICLPLIGGKEFLDKYLFDYEPYIEFLNSQEGFVYVKEFIEDQFKFLSFEDAFDVDSY